MLILYLKTTNNKIQKQVKMVANDDKLFFSIGSLAGVISESETIFKAQVIESGLGMVLFQAGLVAFITGFVGLFAKKLAEFIYNNLKDKCIKEEGNS